ncbi:MAG: serine/threonine-protein kinase [Thermoleophilia bacterium]
MNTLVLAGRTVGPWALEERIGAGGQAEVFRARHVASRRPAAVKLFHPAVWADPGFRVRFRREREALSQLRHPHVVPVLDAGEADGRGYLAMGLARGGTLAQRIARGDLGRDEALAVLAAVARALDAAHDAGHLHRDVTPGNILLDPEGPWLADFGIARRIDATAVTGEGLLIGTAGFMAPEVIAGHPAGRAADRYALAAVAFEALAGRPPFEADGVPGLLYAHAHRPPPRASAVRPGLPRSLDQALARGLAKDPAGRPATAGALVDSLAAALRPDRTRVMGRPAPSAGRRRRLLSAGPAALLVSGVVVLGAAAAGLTATLSGGDGAGTTRSASGAPPPEAVVLTVPGAGGAAVAAGAAAPDDMPGVAPAPDAAAADVGGARVAAVPGGWERLAPVRRALADRRGLTERPVEVDGSPVGYRVGDAIDLLLGLTSHRGLFVVDGAGGTYAVVVTGTLRDINDYVDSVDGLLVAPPEGA